MPKPQKKASPAKKRTPGKAVPKAPSKNSGKASSRSTKASVDETTLLGTSSSTYPTPVVDELKASFLSYALSVIVARALPDVRDGMKPVHRRILYSLYAQRILPDGPYKKSARVVGDTMARYHPHGDSAIYEALVRLAQDFSMRLPLIDPHGNFGSLDDSPAASRYTECRLALPGLSLLEDIDENTVDFVENYDGTEKEPSVLPAAFPNLLVNGSTGVAVGMATNIPPHNLEEILDACIYLLQNPNCKVSDLLKIVKGPDFPTGGELVDRSSLASLYQTGKGSFTVRAKARIVDVSKTKKGIEVTELPYMVGPEKVVARVRDLVSNKRLPGISDVKDLSDRSTGLKLLFEIKQGFNPEVILSELYRLTPMQESFPAMLVALVDGRPKVCSLLDLVEGFVSHRLDVVYKRSAFRSDRSSRRAHLLEGVLLALADLDEVVALIRSSKDPETAKERLMKKIKLSAEQAVYVLEMPLRRLTTIEADKVRQELATLRAEIKSLSKILSSKKVLADSVVEDLKTLSLKFSSPRRTKLSATHVSLPTPDINNPASFEEDDLSCVVALTKSGTLGKVSILQGKAKSNLHDAFVSKIDSSTKSTIWGVSRFGLLVECKVQDLTDLPRGSKGVPAYDLFSLSADDSMVSLVQKDKDLMLVTASGVVKVVSKEHLRPASVISLSEKDEVIAAFSVEPSHHAAIVSSSGQLLRLEVGKIRPQQRAAAGVAGINLEPSEKVVAACSFAPEDFETPCIFITSQGSLKTTLFSEFPVKGRATGGVRTVRFNQSETHLLAAGFGTMVPFSQQGVSIVPPPASKRDGASFKPDTPAYFAAYLRP